MPACLILVCGLPGAGKTTTATHLAATRRGIRLCPDDWMAALGFDIWDEAARARIEALQGVLAAELLTAGNTVVIEWGMWSRAERDAARDSARAVGATVELHFLDAPVGELFRRIDTRDRERSISGRAITLQELEHWSRLVERPTAEELACYDVGSSVQS